MVYYGSVDATLLWIILFYKYLKKTNDWETFKKLWPYAQKAYQWIEEFGDKDRDGFIEYRKSYSGKNGLYNQGWKDSFDAIRHKDSKIAEAPIAVVEVQGYLFLALKYLSYFFKKVGDFEKSRKIL